jgi:hypothetical protein
MVSAAARVFHHAFVSEHRGSLRRLRKRRSRRGGHQQRGASDRNGTECHLQYH